MEDPEPTNEAVSALIRQATEAIAQNDGSVASRAEIISMGQKLLSLMSADDPIRDTCIATIARALHDQYEATGEWDALESAVDLLGEAIENTDEDDETNAATLGDLYSRCLRSRFMRGRNEEDLENAIQFGKDSVERTSNLDVGNHIELLVDRQNNLSLCYFTKAHQLDDAPPQVLEDAISLAKDSVELVRELKDPQKLWLETTSALGMYLQVRWDRNRQEEDIEQAIDIGYQVLAKCPDQPEAQQEALSNLAFRLQRGYNQFLRHKLSHESLHLMRGKTLLEESLSLIIQSMKIESERQLSKLHDAMTFVLYIKEFPLEIQPDVLSKTFSILKDQVELMEQIAIMSNLEDRQDLLSTCYGLSRYAAAAVIEAKLDPFEALRLLEIGRGLVISIQFSYSDNEDLAGVDTLLRDAYVSARKNLNRAIEEGRPFHERQRLLTALQESRRSIRCRSGFEDFDKSLSKSAMMEMSSGGPIIVINVTDIKCHAIIINQNSIRAIPLPETNEDMLSERSWEIQQLLAKEERGHETIHDLYLKLSAFLKDLWKWIALPILSDQGYDQVPSDEQGWPHVWWILTGVLSLYPIHAAGVGLHSKKNNVMNRVISSYTPNLKTLSRARAQYELLQATKTVGSSSESMPATSITVVTMPDTPERVSLEYAGREGSEIASLFPHAEVMVNPNKEKVVDALTRGPAVMHFSCHGEVDYDFPWKSKILLRDWQEDPLTVQDIHNLRLSNRQNSQVAVLSACFTANAGVENLQDEMDHLISALQIAGFMSLVGTLWDVQQKSAYNVVREFYSALARKGGGFDAKDVATVLHFAVLKFRESTREVGNDMRGNPVIWAPFVNFGI